MLRLISIFFFDRASSFILFCHISVGFKPMLFNISVMDLIVQSATQLIILCDNYLNLLKRMSLQNDNTQGELFSNSTHYVQQMFSKSSTFREVQIYKSS